MSGMKRRAVWALALFWAALLVCSVCLGRYEIAPREVAHILLGGPADPTAAALLFSIRLPRLALVAFSGGSSVGWYSQSDSVGRRLGGSRGKLGLL